METYHIRKQIHRLPGKVIHTVPLPQPQLVEGHGARKKMGKICQKCGYKNVLVVTDQTLSSLGYEQAITQALEEAEIHYAVYNDINSEPTIDLIEAGRKKAIECQAECVIALGGGSVMDTTKMIAAGAKMPRRSVKSLLIKFLPVPGKTLPMISVPSTAGTGAEVTVGAVVHNSQGVKTSTVLIGLDVTHVVLDSELTIHAPQTVTAACGMDALSHVIEGAVSDVKVDEANMYLSKEGVRLIFENLPIVMREPENIEARLNMCRAAYFGGHAINTQLAGYVHAFAHSIGAKYHLPHGQAISLMLMPVLEFQKKVCTEKYAMLARHCHFAHLDTDDEQAAELFLQAVAQLMTQCGMDKLVSPVKTEDYAELISMVAQDSINYSSPITLNNNDIEQILKTVTPNP
ncbi:MAG: iron-containing alcohol dehydrogenase [Bacteroidales bacterium]|nr:iron-containing alcohol dehydrogenase [Bacteroidales bacterium]MBR6929272.1 iron-containing alcohol dehydrogenase [Bacteroidales bacterium]